MTCYLFPKHKYQNFKKLSLITEYQIVQDKEKHVTLSKDMLQKALDLAVKNVVSHIQKLSQIAE